MICLKATCRHPFGQCLLFHCGERLVCKMQRQKLLHKLNLTAAWYELVNLPKFVHNTEANAIFQPKQHVFAWNIFTNKCVFFQCYVRTNKVCYWDTCIFWTLFLKNTKKVWGCKNKLCKVISQLIIKFLRLRFHWLAVQFGSPKVATALNAAAGDGWRSSTSHIHFGHQVPFVCIWMTMAIGTALQS